MFSFGIAKVLCPNTTDGRSYECPQLEGMWIRTPIANPAPYDTGRFYNGKATRGDFGVLNGRFVWGWFGYPKHRGEIDGVYSPAEVRTNLKC